MNEQAHMGHLVGKLPLLSAPEHEGNSQAYANLPM